MLFKPSLFFCDMEFESREDVLAFMSRQLCEQGYAGSGFFESVMQREAIAPTALSRDLHLPTEWRTTLTARRSAPVF